MSPLHQVAHQESPQGRSPHPRRARLWLVVALALIAPQVARALSTAERVASALDAWDVESAAAALAQLQREEPDSDRTRLLAGRVAFEQGDYDRAVTLMEQALGGGDHPDLRLARGAKAENEGNVTEESAHFVLSHKPGRDAALVPYALEGLEAAWSALTADLGYAPPSKVRVELFGTPRALARVSSLPEKAIRTTGTVALCKYNRLLVSSPRALVRGYDWLDTMAHEFVHLLVTRRSRDTVPIWLHEGIAKYLETRWRGAAGAGLDAGQEALLAKAVRNGTLVTFERMSPSIALLPSQEEAALAYAEVATFVQYLVERRGMAGLRQLLDLMRDGRSDRDAVATVMAMPFEKVESDWRTRLKDRPVPPLAAQPRRNDFKDDATRARDARPKEGEKSYERGELGSLPTPEARKFAHLGELLRARGRARAAVQEFEKALAAGGAGHPALARKYALTLLALGSGARAAGALRDSLARHPEDETNHLLYGRILVQEGQSAAAREHFVLANHRDPFDAEIHKGLLAVARATGDGSLESRETRVLEILDGRRQTWRATPPGAAGLAYLRVERPAGLRLVIDGVDSGLTTPVADHPLPAGAHTLRLEGPGAPAGDRKVELPPDELYLFDPAAP